MALHRCFLERVLQAHVQLFRIRRGEHPTGVFPRSTSYGSLHEIGVGPALSALPSIAHSRGTQPEMWNSCRTNAASTSSVRRSAGGVLGAWSGPSRSRAAEARYRLAT